MSTAPTAAVPKAAMRPVLPSRGLATVKSVLSGDTVVLTNGRQNVVIFTFERVTAPR